MSGASVRRPSDRLTVRPSAYRPFALLAHSPTRPIALSAYLALGATTRYEIAGATLTLFGPDGPVARLEVASAAPN